MDWGRGTSVLCRHLQGALPAPGSDVSKSECSDRSVHLATYLTRELGLCLTQNIVPHPIHHPWLEYAVPIRGPQERSPAGALESQSLTAASTVPWTGARSSPASPVLYTGTLALCGWLGWNRKVPLTSNTGNLTTEKAVVDTYLGGEPPAPLPGNGRSAVQPLGTHRYPSTTGC